MKIQRTLLLAGSLTCGATAALAEGNLVIHPGGQMRIQLTMISDQPVDQTTPVTVGRVEIAPIVMVPGFVGRFSLNHMSLGFADFAIDRRPFGESHFRAVGVHLRGAVSFWAVESPPGVYTFSIPPDEITFYGGALVEHDLYAGEERPSQDVIGKIDLNYNTFQARAVFLKQKTVLGVTVGGPVTVTLSGVIGPGPTGGSGPGAAGGAGPGH
jgi:hypothetical protein